MKTKTPALWFAGQWFRREASSRVWALVVLYAGLIFYFSSLPGDSVPSPFSHADIVFHFLEYFPFGFLLALAITRTFGRLGRRALLFFVFVIVLYALSDEIHQIFVPERTFSLFDLVFDCLGSAAGALSLLWLRSNHS
jgi:VanZ family protein